MGVEKRQWHKKGSRFSQVSRDTRHPAAATLPPSIMSLSKPEDQLALELTCPICLQLYSDPVVLPCGHNYCQACICKTAKNHGSCGRTQCPECREEFQGVESLQKNFKLCSIVEGYRATAALLGMEPETQPEVLCDHCIDEQTPAVKVCLKCQVSLCSRHLQRHQERDEFKEHTLVEPLNELEVKGCVVHRRPLEYFCSTECSSLCATCIAEGRHRDHDILAFGIAEEETRRSLESRSKVSSSGFHLGIDLPRTGTNTFLNKNLKSFGNSKSTHAAVNCVKFYVWIFLSFLLHYKTGNLKIKLLVAFDSLSLGNGWMTRMQKDVLTDELTNQPVTKVDRVLIHILHSRQRQHRDHIYQHSICFLLSFITKCHKNI